jgi:hypothetical protein
MYIQIACRQPVFVLFQEGNPVLHQPLGGVVAFLSFFSAVQEAERLGNATVEHMTLGEFLQDCEAEMRYAQMPDGRVGQVGIFAEIEEG